MFNLHELANLPVEGDHAVSIYLTLAKGQHGSDPRAPLVALHSLLEQAERQLLGSGVPKRAIEPILGEARELLHGDWLRNRHPAGMALFMAPRQFRRVDLPVGIPDKLVIGPRFFLKPLLPLVEGEGKFYVLAATAGDSRLWRGSRFAFDDITPQDMPRGVDQIAAGGPGVSQGFETPEDLRKELLLEHLKRLAHAVCNRVNAEPACLMIAADPEVAGHLRKYLKLNQLHDQLIEGNPFALGPDILHSRAYELVRPKFEHDLQEAEERIRARLGTAEPNVAIRLEEIISHARFGRIDSLLLAEDAVMWGRFDEASNAVLAHGSPAPGDEDLLNYAAVMTLSNGGKVHTLARDRLPRQAMAAAALRY